MEQAQQKKRCPDVAEAIINYFRQECAIFDSEKGIEVENDKLSEAIGAGQSIVSKHLRRLYDLEIIVLKSGIYEPRSRSPKFLALGKGYEEGNEWKRIYYKEGDPTINKAPAKAILPGDLIQIGSKAISDKNLLQELVQAYARIKDLQERVLNVQHERNDALDTIQRKQARIEELEHDLRVTSESARTNQREITTLDLQLREARSQVASQARRIAKNDETKPVFATR